MASPYSGFAGAKIAGSGLEKAVQILLAGGVVAFPTETVYGLGANAENPAAVRRIFEIKGRPTDHPLIVHLSEAQEISKWACRIPPLAWRLAEHFWPGPLTLVLPRSQRVPNIVTGNQDTVALRVPAHPLALALLRAAKLGLAAPSANRFGHISPTEAQHVKEELGTAVDLILDGGPCQVGVESTIVSVVGDRPLVLRPGGITLERLSEVAGAEVRLAGNTEQIVRAPGMLASHYAPTTPLYVLAADQLWRIVDRLMRRGLRVAVLAVGAGQENLPESTQLCQVIMPAEPQAYAHGLYTTLRRLDAAGYDMLLVESVPPGGAWLAVRDRLQRASQSIEGLLMGLNP